MILPYNRLPYKRSLVYPQVLKGGKQFKIRIRTEGSDGCSSEKIMLVDPNRTLQKGGIVKAISTNDLNHAKRRKLVDHDKTREDETDISIQEQIKFDTDHKGVIDDSEELKEETSKNGHEYKINLGLGVDVELPPNQLFNCEQCEKAFHDRGALERHKTSRHGDVGPLHKKCEVCGKWIRCIRGEAFSEHMQSMHGAKPGVKYEIQCFWCKKNFSTLGIKNHAMRKHFYGNFQCEHCSFSSHNAKHLVNHVNEYHKLVSSVKCPLCKQDHPIECLEAEYKNCIQKYFRDVSMDGE